MQTIRIRVAEIMIVSDCRCHNPEVHAFTFGGSTVYVLFHIGLGTEGHPRYCNSSTDEARPALALSTTIFAAANASGATVHYASSLNGPWTPVYGFPSCNNPSAMQHPNGTLFALCDSTVLWRSESVAGPWFKVTTLELAGGPDCTLEDGFLWMDPPSAGGAWHALFHCWSNVIPHSGSCVSTNVSAHAFSPDGLNWSIWPTQPFDGTPCVPVPSNRISCVFVYFFFPNASVSSQVTWRF